MARIRSIHPGLFTDDAFMEASSYGRLLLIGLLTEAHDDGVFEWKPLTLKARLFPADSVNVAELLEQLAGLNFIRQFATESGKQYGAIRNFRRFQRPKKPNSSGVLPAEFGTYVGLPADSSEPVPNYPPINGVEFPISGGKSPQMEDGGEGGGGRGGGDNEYNIHSKVPRERPGFAGDGSIAYTPFAAIARQHGRGIDIDVLASAFRSFCRASDTPLDSPWIASSFTKFCQKHRIGRAA